MGFNDYFNRIKGVDKKITDFEALSICQEIAASNSVAELKLISNYLSSLKHPQLFCTIGVKLFQLDEKCNLPPYILVN